MPLLKASPPIRKPARRLPVQAVYKEEDFPALRLARSGRNIRRLGKALMWILAVVVVAMFFAPWVQNIGGRGSVIALDPFERIQDVRAPVKGRIASRGEGITENAYVKKGQELFTIEDLDPEYLPRLRSNLENARNKLATAESRLEQAELAKSYAVGVVKRTEEQLESMRLAQTEAVASALAKVESAKNKREEAEQGLKAAEASLLLKRLNYERTKSLYKNEFGQLESQFDFEKATNEFDQATAKVAESKAKIEAAKNDVIAEEKNVETKRQEYNSKLDEIRGKLEAANGKVQEEKIKIAKNKEEINQEQIKVNKAETDFERQRSQKVLSPKDGYIMDLAVFELGTIVKETDKLCRIVPKMTKPAAAIMVSGNDAPLIAPGDKVRLQFEGWPAIQFSGWPSTAVGTFGGEVALVDPSDNGKGMFRIVVTPDPEDDQPWPEHPWLRQGVQAKGWVLLETVPLGYEMWRRMNGFPPALTDAKQPKSESKPPKVKI
ncbi:MAG: hypothetical protein AAGJ46_08030 [Planctomycetota bacterium]